MILAGVDTETTGIKYGDHRFVEVYVGLYDSATRTRLFAYETRINPERSIQAEAERIHKISAADVAGSPTWQAVAPVVHKALSKADLIIGHNLVGFDMPFINYELKRIGLPEIIKPMFDTMQEGRWGTAHGKVPNLGELCFACGVEYDTTKAHAANFDVDVMMQCYFHGIEHGFFKHKTGD